MCQITVSLLIQLFLAVIIVFLGIFLKIICKSFINRTEKLCTELLLSEKRSRGNTVFLQYIELSCPISGWCAAVAWIHPYGFHEYQ